MTDPTVAAFQSAAVALSMGVPKKEVFAILSLKMPAADAWLAVCGGAILLKKFVITPPPVQKFNPCSECGDLNKHTIWCKENLS